MMEIIFAVIILIFGLFSIYNKNEYIRQFFFLLTLLIMTTSFYLPSFVKETNTCIDEGASYCIKYEVTHTFSISNIFAFGFGMILIFFFFVILINILITVFKGIV